MAKCVARDMAMKVTTDAVHIFGGADYMNDVPVQRFMRDAKIPEIFEGTNQIHRRIVARQPLAGGVASMYCANEYDFVTLDACRVLE
jgi:alkylation response protein AidB-like acyl-CoA dehydrogenase